MAGSREYLGVGYGIPKLKKNLGSIEETTLYIEE